MRLQRVAGAALAGFMIFSTCGLAPAAQGDACLVLDIDMPGVGGIGFKQALVDSGRDRPTVFITASEREGLDAQLARLAPVAVLRKPFNNKELLEALARAFA